MTVSETDLESIAGPLVLMVVICNSEDSSLLLDQLNRNDGGVRFSGIQEVMISNAPQKILISRDIIFTEHGKQVFQQVFDEGLGRALKRPTHVTVILGSAVRKPYPDLSKAIGYENDNS